MPLWGRGAAWRWATWPCTRVTAPKPWGGLGLLGAAVDFSGFGVFFFAFSICFSFPFLSFPLFSVSFLLLCLSSPLLSLSFSLFLSFPLSSLSFPLSPPVKGRGGGRILLGAQVGLLPLGAVLGPASSPPPIIYVRGGHPKGTSKFLLAVSGA